MSCANSACFVDGNRKRNPVHVSDSQRYVESFLKFGMSELTCRAYLPDRTPLSYLCDIEYELYDVDISVGYRLSYAVVKSDLLIQINGTKKRHRLSHVHNFGKKFLQISQAVETI